MSEHWDRSLVDGHNQPERTRVHNVVESRLCSYLKSPAHGDCDSPAVGHWLPLLRAMYHSTAEMRSCPKNISSSTNKVGTPKAPRWTASLVLSIRACLTSGRWMRFATSSASKPPALRTSVSVARSAMLSARSQAAR